MMADILESCSKCLDLTNDTYDIRAWSHVCVNEGEIVGPMNIKPFNFILCNLKSGRCPIKLIEMMKFYLVRE